MRVRLISRFILQKKISGADSRIPVSYTHLYCRVGDLLFAACIFAARYCHTADYHTCLLYTSIIFSLFIGYNIYSVENSQQTFDFSFLNIEALASGESCGYCPEYGLSLIHICDVFLVLWVCLSELF